MLVEASMAWQVFDAKARFSEFLDSTLKDGPQVLTRRGVETAVLVPMDEWKRLQDAAKRATADPLLDPKAPHDLYISSTQASEIALVVLR
jgi:prevent-host-death family protein